MKWFGESWNAPACEPDEHVETPVGRVCAYECGKAIEAGDQGVVLPYYGRTSQPADLAYHRDCFLESILGPDWKEMVAGHANQEVMDALGTFDRAGLEFVDPGDPTKGFRRKSS